MSELGRHCGQSEPPHTERIMSLLFRRIVMVVTVGVFAACEGNVSSEPYDLVILGGRVVDPESSLSALRNIGIRNGLIEAVSEDYLDGASVIDATGHVVSPGFIDLHEHGQSELEYGLMVRDGVTSAFELEVGTGDVEQWYAERASGQYVNYGVSIGHIKARMAVLNDPSESLLPAGVGGSGRATGDQIAAMEVMVRQGLEEGAVAVGFGSAYTPGAEMDEIEQMFTVAAEYGASAHIHIRGGGAGLDSTIASARRAGVALHVVHVNSSAGGALNTFLASIETAQGAGQDVTTEAYPYRAGMTEIQSALFDNWADWPEERFATRQLVSTGERLTRESFARAREEGGYVIMYDRTEELTQAAVASPLTIIASDGFMEGGRGHPRTSGSYSKILGRYVRDLGVLTLEEALAKMTIMPARRLEARVPAMAKKARLQVGADADLTVFDPITVIDRSTYVDATIPAEGVPYVIVAGQVVVSRGDLTGQRPGRQIRAPTQ